jgi:transcriptional regulator with XRE-family HTH domain
MSPNPMRGVGQRIATARRARNLTQSDLAASSGMSYATIRAIEREARFPSDDALDAIAAALGLDPSRLLADGGRTNQRITVALPAVSAAIAAYDIPQDVPTRSLESLRATVAEATVWRLASQYVRLAETMAPLLQELAAAYHASSGQDQLEAARLLAVAYRSTDAVAYKCGSHDLSARLVDLMRWAAEASGDPLLKAAAAYVRTETFFAARAHVPGLRALEAAVDAAPSPVGAQASAARGALHMRAAVIAGRAAEEDAAWGHLGEARRLADRVPEGVYQGTAFGPSSVRIHEVSVAVSLGGDHVQHAIDVASTWAPPRDLPAERRSGFYVELSRAQLWAGRRADALESLKVARRIAPQHTREHAWARETAETLLRLRRRGSEDLQSFAEWIGAT